jgi:hypothetical protein
MFGQENLCDCLPAALDVYGRLSVASVRRYNNLMTLDVNNYSVAWG